jgi:hypothetical protein
MKLGKAAACFSAIFFVLHFAFRKKKQIIRGRPAGPIFIFQEEVPCELRKKLLFFFPSNFLSLFFLFFISLFLI